MYYVGGFNFLMMISRLLLRFSSVSDIISKKKNKEIANPRQICMYLSRKYTDYSLQNIGKIMGNRDHTTVIHGHDKIGKMLETDENLKSNLDIIIKKLNPPT